MKKFFKGWYFKCQSNKYTLALIPSYHKIKNKEYFFLQIITDKSSFYIKLSESKEYYFGYDGILINFISENISVKGSLSFGPLSTIKFDIMGPFACIPFMECKHSVYSMKHTVNGFLSINGEEFIFNNDIGYIEGDQGYSFPKEYAWTHCFFKDGSLMLSVADIPLKIYNFTGVICVIHWQGKEYRLASYLGAKVTKINDGEIIIKQNDFILKVKLLEKNHRLLSAPANGIMNRKIKESIICKASYHLQKNNKTLFSFISNRASFEYEYHN